MKEILNWTPVILMTFGAAGGAILLRKLKGKLAKRKQSKTIIN